MFCISLCIGTSNTFYILVVLWISFSRINITITYLPFLKIKSIKLLIIDTATIIASVPQINAAIIMSEIAQKLASIPITSNLIIKFNICITSFTKNIIQLVLLCKKIIDKTSKRITYYITIHLYPYWLHCKFLINSTCGYIIFLSCYLIEKASYFGIGFRL